MMVCSGHGTLNFTLPDKLRVNFRSKLEMFMSKLIQDLFLDDASGIFYSGLKNKAKSSGIWQSFKLNYF